MTDVREIRVDVQDDHLQSFTRSPQKGIEELIWNALDADADVVQVVFGRNDAGGVEAVHVIDDGHGMTPEEVDSLFGRLGGSWKAKQTKTRTKGRSLHGRQGRGRWYAFGIRGESVTWRTVAEVTDGSRVVTTIRGRAASLTRFEISGPEPTNEAIGTRVSIEGISEDPRPLLADQIYDNLTTRFALHLEQYRGTILYDGVPLDPTSLQLERYDLAIDIEAGYGPAFVTVVEWRRQVDPAMYLCDSEGIALGTATPPSVPRRYYHTSYARWQGFREHEDELELSEMNPLITPVVEASRDAVRDHFAAREREERERVIEAWKEQHVYPFQGESDDPVEQTERGIFDVVAVAAAPAVNAGTDPKARRFTLALLREALISGPSSLRRVLQEVLDLPPDTVEELNDLLTSVPLSSVVAVARRVSDRLDFIEALRLLIFDTGTKKHVLERAHLHRLLEPETWLFGEEFAVGASDRTLNTVLTEHIRILGREELAPDVATTDADGSLRVDLMLARNVPLNRERKEHLVVELKRPSIVIGSEELTQIQVYADEVSKDPRFNKVEVSWDFFIVGGEFTSYVEGLANQENRPPGLVSNARGNVRVWAMTWAQILNAADYRLKFVRDALQYESNTEAATEYLRRAHEMVLENARLTFDKKPRSKGKSPAAVEEGTVAVEEAVSIPGEQLGIDFEA